MLALLFTLCLLLIVVLVAVVLGLVGVLTAIVSVMALVNLSVVALGALHQRRRGPAETWQPDASVAEAEGERERIVADDQSIHIERIAH